MLPAASTLGLKAYVNWPMGEVFAAQPELLDLRLSSESKLTMEALKPCKALPLHFISLHTYPGAGVLHNDVRSTSKYQRDPITIMAGM